MEKGDIAKSFDNLLQELLVKNIEHPVSELRDLVNCVLTEDSCVLPKETSIINCYEDLTPANNIEGTPNQKDRIELFKKSTPSNSLTNDADEVDLRNENLPWVYSKLWEESSKFPSELETLEKSSYHTQHQCEKLNNSSDSTKLSYPLLQSEKEDEHSAHVKDKSVHKNLKLVLTRVQTEGQKSLFSSLSTTQNEPKKISTRYPPWLSPNREISEGIFLDESVGGSSEQTYFTSKMETQCVPGMKLRSAIPNSRFHDVSHIEPLVVNLYVENKRFHAGPLELKIYPKVSLKMLKTKIHNDLKIKPNFQKWIIGNQLITNDDLSLNILPQRSVIYLYLENSDLSQNRICRYFLESPFYSTVENSLSGKFGTNYSHRKITAKERIFGESTILGMQNASKIQEENSLRKSKPSCLSEKLKVLKQQHSGKAFEKPNYERDSEDQQKSTINNKLSEAVSIKHLSQHIFDTNKSSLTNEIKTIGVDSTRSNCISNEVGHLEVTDDFSNVEFSNKYTGHDLKYANRDDIVQCSKICDPLNLGDDIDRMKRRTEIASLKTEDVYLSPTSSNEDSFSTCGSSASLSETDLKTTKNGDSETKHVEKESGNDIRDENYHSLLQLESLSVIPSNEAFECPVCFSSISAGQGVILRDCLHMFCKECLACAVIYSPSSIVKCPYRDFHYSCDSSLQQREIKALVSLEIYEQYLQRSLSTAESLAEKSFHCKTADCLGWCLYEDAINIFLCPICLHYNCLTCQAIHEGLNCKQYQDNLKKMVKLDENAIRTLEFLEKMIMDGKAMNCPKCQVVLMKKWGCDWLKCSVCHTEVCWITKGARWGPQGPGDISAGCRCGVEGRKCHPKCTYCH